MWVFTKEGFVSITANKHGDGLHAKARRRSDLAGLVDDAEIRQMDGDYPFHCSVSTDRVAAWLDAEVRSVNYTNFKGQIKDDGYYQALLKIWYVLLDQFGGYGRLKRSPARGGPEEDRSSDTPS